MVLVAPAMNRQMWETPATQRNVAQLEKDGVTILGPASGDQACGETGNGRMLEAQEIADAVAAFLAPKSLAGVHVLMTAGPTFEPIDAVRGITNRSSGKMGYAIAPKNLMLEFRKVHQFNAFVSNGPVQYAFADYMKNKDAYLSLAAFYQRKRDFFLGGLKGSRFKPLRTRGTFFQNLAYDAISDEKDTELAIRLTRDHGVAAIPVSVFYRDPPAHKVLRFCFAKSEDTLAKGAAILRKL